MLYLTTKHCFMRLASQRSKSSNTYSSKFNFVHLYYKTMEMKYLILNCKLISDKLKCFYSKLDVA